MPNPRYLTKDGEPTVELLDKLGTAKKIYYGGIKEFCEKYYLDENDFKNVKKIFLIGSHAKDTAWCDETSDLDFKLIVDSVSPTNLLIYRREVLDKKLKQGNKKRWIDLFFAKREDMVLDPKWDLTDYWNDKRI